MILFDHVSKVYPNGTVGLRDVDLTIQDGEFVAIIGRSGAGKSTLLRAVNRMHSITGGQLTIEYFPNGELGADADILRQMKANEIQLVVCQTAPVVSFVPEVAVFDLPMVFAKYDGATIDKVLNGDSAFKAQLGGAFNNSGFQLLGTLQNATYRLTTAKKDLQTLADFNGLQIRTMENQNHMAFWTAIGAQPTPMAWNEVYFALQSGNIAAQENAADTCVGNNLNEVQDYLAFTNHILYANMMIMNQEAYDSLDPLYQEALGQAVAEAMAEIGAQLATIDADNKAELERGWILTGATIEELGQKIKEFDPLMDIDTLKATFEEYQGFAAAGGAEDNDVGLGQQLVHGDEPHGLALAALRLVPVDHGEDCHAKGLTLSAHHLANAAVADDAHGLALQLKALGVGLLLPPVLPHGVARDGEEAGAGKHVAHSQLRHGVGGSPRRILHRDAVVLGVLHVDVVHADAAADDQLQSSALRLVDVAGADLRGAAHHHRVKILQRRAQLLGGIELLHHLVAVGLELCQGGLVHPVSD